MKRFWYSEVIRSARLAIPPTRPLFFFCLLLALFEYFYLKFERGVASGMDGPSIVLLQFGAALYGIYRVAAFHPNLRPRYREWLRMTAWRSPQPLPLGSITLTITDALLLLLAAALIYYWHPERSPFRPALCFSMAYLLAMAMPLFFVGPRRFAYLVVFGLGGMFMSLPHEDIALAVGLATYFVAWAGLREALRNLREIETRSFEHLFVRPGSLQAAELASVNVGWPFGYLAPYRSVPHLAIFDSICLPIVLGWLLASFMTCVTHVSNNSYEANEKIVVFGFYFAASGLLAGRMIVHLQYHRPPISLLGRLITLRWIIPRYDRAYAAPFAALVLLWTFAWPLFRERHPSIVVASSLLTIALLVGLVPGPSFHDWMLTSECRIAPQRPPAQRR